MNENNQKSRGLGDTISKVTHALGIEECDGCAWRREKLNEIFPYKEEKNKTCQTQKTTTKAQ